MFRHLITGINVKKLIEMQSKRNEKVITHTRETVSPTCGKKLTKRRTRID